MHVIIGSLLLFLIFMHPVDTMADNITNNKSNIILDGNFNDWDGKPEFKEVNDHENVKNEIALIKYIADNQYLYLYVKRNEGSKAEQWHFSVIIPNALSGQNTQIQLFNKGEKVFVPVFDITSTLENGATIVNVSYNGQNIESTLSGSKNNKEIEFRIPLAMVGLSGFNQEVQFALMLDGDNQGDYIWVPNEYPITITTGPTGWQYTSVLFFVGVTCLLVVRKYRS